VHSTLWLKNLRNKVAVHPIYISHGNIRTETPAIAEWQKQSIKKDIEILFQFLDEANQKQMPDVLENQKDIEDIHEWGLSEDIIQILALKAYKKMKRVIEGIYYSH
jgi:gamma-glutamyl phosphate reductase